MEQREGRARKASRGMWRSALEVREGRFDAADREESQRGRMACDGRVVGALGEGRSQIIVAEAEDAGRGSFDPARKIHTYLA